MLNVERVSEFDQRPTEMGFFAIKHHNKAIPKFHC